MINGKCPKCGGAHVHVNDAQSVKITMLNEVKTRTYICGNCGYLETYVRQEWLDAVRNKTAPVPPSN